MNKFPTTNILAVVCMAASVVATYSNIRYGEKIQSLEDNQWLDQAVNRRQERIIREQDQLLINLYTEVERLKILTDGFMPAPEPSVPTIIQL